MTDAQIVLQICGATNAQVVALEITESLDTLQAFATLSAGDIKDLASKLERRPLNQGRIRLPIILVKRIQALCFWACKKQKLLQPLVAAEFTLAELQLAADQMREANEEKADAPSIKPKAFTATGWKVWKQSFKTYLSNFKGAQDSPLDYITRIMPRPDDAALALLTDRERELYAYPLTGPHFSDDNRRVYRLLSDVVSDTEGWTYISEFNPAQNGRLAWTSLQAHYDGGGQNEKRVAEAEAIIDTVHYKNEATYKFDTMGAKLLEAFRTLRDAGQEKPAYEQVKTLLEKDKIESAQVEIAKAHVRQYYRRDMDGALEYLSTEFARQFPVATFQNVRRHGRNIHAAGGDTSRRRTGYDSYEGTTAESDQPQEIDGIITFHGVDVTDTGRSFTSQEMTQLTSQGQAYVFRTRDELGLNRGGGGRGGRTRRWTRTSRRREVQWRTLWRRPSRTRKWRPPRWLLPLTIPIAIPVTIPTTIPTAIPVRWTPYWLILYTNPGGYEHRHD